MFLFLSVFVIKFNWYKNCKCKTLSHNVIVLVTGIAGGSKYDHTGGGSSYLCLTRQPQLKDKTFGHTQVGYLYGAEYVYMEEHSAQDAVCSLCHTNHTSTVMILATLTCPQGWTLQYSGQLATQRYNFKSRTEFICLDDTKEHDEGGEGYQYGAYFSQVLTSCGALPCPPGH